MNDETENNGTEAMDDDWAAAMAEQEQADAVGATAPAATSSPKKSAAESASFQELEEEVSGEDQSEIHLESILDVPVTIAMEIGRAHISIRNLLQLNQGSVVELDRLAGEPMDVLVNGTLIAQGEVVVVNEKFGIRLTDVISPADRIRRLK